MCTCVDSESVAFGGSHDVGRDDIPDDDVFLPAKVETDPVKSYELPLAYSTKLERDEQLQARQ